MTLDVSGLAALVARGVRARCKWVVSGLARVSADCAYRATAAAAPAPTRTPLGPALTSSMASGWWGVVPKLGTGGWGGAVCAPPPQPVCGGGLYAVPPSQLDWWVGLCHGEVGAVCCHADMNW